MENKVKKKKKLSEVRIVEKLGFNLNKKSHSNKKFSQIVHGCLIKKTVICLVTACISYNWSNGLDPCTRNMRIINTRLMLCFFSENSNENLQSI